MLGKPQRGYRLVGLVVRGPPSPVSTGPQNVYTSAYLLAYMRPDCAIDAAAVHLSTKVDTNQASAGRKALSLLHGYIYTPTTPTHPPLSISPLYYTLPNWTPQPTRSC